MSDLDLLLTWKAWEACYYEYDIDGSGRIFGTLFSAPAEEFIDAFLDSWHSAWGYRDDQ